MWNEYGMGQNARPFVKTTAAEMIEVVYKGYIKATQTAFKRVYGYGEVPF
jgi:hypothetical protein